MHYIRLLRSPTLSRSGKRLLLGLLFTITTDLGDSFLFPDDSIDIELYAEIASASGVLGVQLSGPGKLQWRPGMRLAKPTIDVPPQVQAALRSGEKVDVCIRAKRAALSAGGVGEILDTTLDASQDGGESHEGQVMPAWVTLMMNRDHDGADVDVSTRRLLLGGPGNRDAYVEFEEEIGESIARHIWDAGVIAFCAIARACMSRTPRPVRPSCAERLKSLLGSRKRLNVLELGCGVGILGVGLTAIYPLMQPAPPPGGGCTVLMTDLEEAEGRARSNMSRLRTPAAGSAAASSVELLYENLDWEDGRKGRFGPEARRRRWDLVMLSDCTYNIDMLPALVETLSALHSSNRAHVSPGEEGEEGEGEGEDGPPATRVFLATKPRHASERALFDLMAREGWAMVDKQILPLPVAGSEAESVELYLYEKA